MVRNERTFEVYSRGLELVRAIRKMWEVNALIPHTHHRVRPTRNEQINTNIETLCGEFDLTVEEWHYWARLAREVH